MTWTITPTNLLPDDTTVFAQNSSGDIVFDQQELILSKTSTAKEVDQ